jgi:hypothetical protein
MMCMCWANVCRPNAFLTKRRETRFCGPGPDIIQPFMGTQSKKAGVFVTFYMKEQINLLGQGSEPTQLRVSLDVKR